MNAALRRRCPRCKAPPGSACTAPMGLLYDAPHPERLKPTAKQARKATSALCHLIDLEWLIHELAPQGRTTIGDAVSQVCDALRAIEDAHEGRSWKSLAT